MRGTCTTRNQTALVSTDLSESYIVLSEFFTIVLLLKLGLTLSWQSC